MFWHGFVLIDKQKMKTGFQKNCNKTKMITVIKK